MRSAVAKQCVRVWSRIWTRSSCWTVTAVEAKFRFQHSAGRSHSHPQFLMYTCCQSKRSNITRATPVDGPFRSSLPPVADTVAARGPPVPPRTTASSTSRMAYSKPGRSLLLDLALDEVSDRGVPAPTGANTRSLNCLAVLPVAVHHYDHETLCAGAQCAHAKESPPQATVGAGRVKSGRSSHRSSPSRTRKTKRWGSCGRCRRPG